MEGMTALALRGRVVKKSSHDVLSVHYGRLECKSRTRYSDGLSYRIALYEKYFSGDTDAVVFGYFDERELLEKAWLVPTAALKPHFNACAKIYKGKLRWRPNRETIESLPEAKDVTPQIRFVEDLI
jgi:hypothetical protein